MRDAKGFMQVEVADITAQITGARQPDHGVHIGPVDIDLASILVHDIADLMHCFFKHAVG